MSFRPLVVVSFVFILILSVSFVIAQDDNLSKLRDTQSNNREDLKHIQEDRMDYIDEQKDKLKNANSAQERKNIINETRENLRDSIKDGMEVRRDIRQNRTEIRELVLSEKDVRFLFLFNTKMTISTEVDSETGEITSVNKPWWAFLARERNNSSIYS